MGKILRQTSWLFSAQLLGRVIGFFYTIFLARSFSVEDFGLFSAALAYFSLVSAIADFGFNRYLIREVARDHFKSSTLLANISLLRITFTAAIFAIFSLAIYSLDPDKFRVCLTQLAILAVLPQSIALTADAIFVAREKLQFSAVSLIVLNISTTILGVWFISSGFGPIGGVSALLLGQIIYVGMLVILLHHHHISFLSVVNSQILKTIIKGSLPYGLLGILGLLYFRIDLLLLTYIQGNFAAGIYGAAYKFLEAIIFVPSSLATALFPVLARLHDNDRQNIKRLYFQSLKLMFVLGIAIMVSYILVLPTVIRLILPNYLPAIEVIKILALTIPFMFIHVPGAQVLLSTDKYLKQILFLSIGTLSFNIILNLLLIPKYGFMGAAWVTVASEALSFLVFFSLLRVKILR
ncbi:MAG: flippase [Candidatus Daviesbacteria bacterium]|nr:flippase [Candidatus Daviesbacteria bacterium]